MFPIISDISKHIQNMLLSIKVHSVFFFSRVLVSVSCFSYKKYLHFVCFFFLLKITAVGSLGSDKHLHSYIYCQQLIIKGTLIMQMKYLGCVDSFLLYFKLQLNIIN